MPRFSITKKFERIATTKRTIRCKSRFRSSREKMWIYFWHFRFAGKPGAAGAGPAENVHSWMVASALQTSKKVYNVNKARILHLHK